MAAKLASTTFATTPDEELLVGDVYQMTDDKVKSRLTDLIDNAGSKLNLSINNRGVVKDLMGLVKVKGGILKIDKDTIKQRLGELKSGMKGSIRAMGVGQVERMLGKYGTSIGDLKQIKVNIGNTVKEFHPDNFKSASDITRLLADLTGDPEFAKHWDLEAEFAMFSGIMEEVIAIGLPEAYDTVMDALALQSADRSVMERVARDALPAILESGNLSAINSSIDRLGAGAILAMQPLIITDIVSRYLHPEGMERSQLPIQAVTLTSTLAKIDAKWYLTDRAGVEISDLSVYSVASRDARELFVCLDDHKTAAMIAPTYMDDHIVGTAKKYFRYAAI